MFQPVLVIDFTSSGKYSLPLFVTQTPHIVILERQRKTCRGLESLRHINSKSVSPWHGKTGFCVLNCVFETWQVLKKEEYEHVRQTLAASIIVP